MVSCLFPLTFSEGVLQLADEVEDNSLVCLGDGPTCYLGIRDELLYYFGEELVAELDKLEEEESKPGKAPSQSAANVVLVVDDDVSLRKILKTILASNGYQIVFAVNGTEAVERASEHLPDVILLDVMLPEMDGFQVCRRLRADARLAPVPILMITALADSASRLRGLEAGADDFISKPFNPQELLARLRTITSLNRYRKLYEQAAELGRANAQLQIEIAERRRAEAALHTLNLHLEQQVRERTAELQATIARLQNEIAERHRIETSLRQMEESLAERVSEQSRKLTALYEVIIVAGQSLAVPDMLQHSLSRVMDVVGGQAACVHQWNPTGAALGLTAQQGLDSAAREQLKIFPDGWLPRDNLPTAVMDLSDADAPAPLRLPGFATCLCASVVLRDKSVGALSVFWREPREFPVEDMALFSAMADQLGIMVENIRLRQVGEEAAVLRERQRLARDLHDSVTQSLHSLVLSADTAQVLLEQDRSARLKLSLTHLAQSARQALKEMRLLLYELRPVVLQELGLVEALRQRLEMVERRAGVDAQLVCPETSGWPPAWEEDVFSVAVEALNNSLKHSRAAQVAVSLGRGVAGLELSVADNGCGFDPQRLPPGGLGLRNMAERAERLGGALEIDSAPGQGTRVKLLVGTRG